MAASSTTERQNSENTEDFLHEFEDLDIFEDGRGLVKRPTCDRCKRPKTVCWCPFLPSEPYQIRTTLYILQHPFEESRSLRTVPILENSIVPDKCRIYKGKRFPNKMKYPELGEVFDSANTFLLYPGENAMDIQDLPTSQELNLILLDGTWSQAKGMYCQNPGINGLKKVAESNRKAISRTVDHLVLKCPVTRLEGGYKTIHECGELYKVQIPMGQKSKYVIRTQPCDQSLSTLETAAIAIATLERRPEIADIITAPLVALCDFQLQHGAIQHQSREYKVENGLWKKPLSKATRRKLEEKRSKRQHEL